MNPLLPIVAVLGLAPSASFDSYRAHIAAADAALLAGDAVRARNWLSRAPKEHRGWEWHYLFGHLGQSIQTIDTGSAINRVALSPDGKTLALAGEDGLIRLLNPITLRQSAELKGHSGPVYGLSFSSDSRTLISTSRDNSIRAWDVERKAKLRKVGDHPVTPYSAALSPDGTKVVSVGWRMHPEKRSPVGLVRVWDFATGALLSDQDLTTHPISCVTFERNGSHAFVGCWEYQVLKIDMSSYAVIKEIAPPESIGYAAVDSVQLAPNQPWLLTSTKDKSAKLFNSESGEFLGKFDSKGQVTASVFAGDYVVVAGADRALRVFNAANQKEVARLLGHEQEIRGMVVTPDGKRAISAESRGVIKSWNLDEPGRYRPEVAFEGAWSCVPDPSGTRLAVGTNQNRIAILDMRTRKVVREISGFGALVVDCAWSPDGAQIAAGSNDGSFRVFEVASGKEKWVHQGSGQLRTAAWSKDGRWVASGQGGKCYLWDAKTGELIHTEPIVNETISAVFSPDSQRVYYGAGAEIKEVAIGNAKKSRTISTRASAVGDIAISPDGKKLAVAGIANTVEVLDISRGASGWTARTGGSQWGIDFSPDGTRVVSTGYDFAVHFFDSRAGLETYAIRDLPLQGFDVRFSPDGQTLAYMAAGGLVWWIQNIN